MPTYTQDLNLIISNGVLQNSSDVFNILDPDSGGANSFTVKLSANGLEPVTHWGCRTILEQATYDALTTMGTTEFKDYVNQMAAIRGRQPVGSVTAFKNNLQIDAGDFWAFIATLGLQRVQDPI
jgi:hypothetical protein